MKEIDSQSLAKYFLYGFIFESANTPTLRRRGMKRIRKDDRTRARKPRAPASPAGRSALGEDVIPQTGKKRFENLDYSVKTTLDEEEVKREVVRLLREAIGKNLSAGAPPAILLSGGVDSGLIAALMREFVPADSIQAFSIAFEEKEVDESLYARKVASRLGIRHFIKTFSQKDALAVARNLGKILEEPMADPSILPTIFLAKFVKEKVDAVLCGDGGDEFFAGYPKYLAHLFLEKTRLGKFYLSPLAKFFPGKLGTFLKYSHYPLHLRNQLWISSFSPLEVEELAGQRIDFSDIEKYHQLFNGQDPLDEPFFLDQNLTLSDLYIVKTERATAATSLEIRCPFFDQDLVEFSAKIPAKLKLKNFQTKYLLRSIAADYLPEDIVKRPKKGFGIPLGRWLNGELRPLVEEMLNPEKIKNENLLNSQAAASVLRRNEPMQIWTLLVFELWLEKWQKS